MIPAADQQRSAAVQTAEDRKIPEGGADILIEGVVREDPDPQRIGQCRLRNRQAEAGIAAPVRAAEQAVAIHGTALIRRVKGEKQPFALRRGDFLFVDAETPVLVVIPVPGVRQIDRLPGKGLRGNLRRAVEGAAGQLSEKPGIVQ